MFQIKTVFDSFWTVVILAGATLYLFRYGIQFYQNAKLVAQKVSITSRYDT